MDPAIIQFLLNSPIYGTLIVLLVRAEQRNTDLMKQICDITAQHSKDILQLTIEFASKITETITK
jgi:hypothetical protein